MIQDSRQINLWNKTEKDTVSHSTKLLVDTKPSLGFISEAFLGVSYYGDAIEGNTANFKKKELC